MHTAKEETQYGLSEPGGIITLVGTGDTWLEHLQNVLGYGHFIGFHIVARDVVYTEWGVHDAAL